MSTALGLAMQISANTAQLATAVRDVERKLDEMGKAGKKAADDLGVLKNVEFAKIAIGGITALTSAITGLGSAFYGAAKNIIGFAKSVADEIDALNDIAKRTGVSVESLQAYTQAANLAGVSSEGFAKSLQKMAINIGKATDEKSQKAFKNLGISFDELKTKSPDEQFEMIADALAKIADPAERAAKAVSIFGKGGIELGPLFEDGPGAMKAIRQEAEKLGYVIKKDGVESIARMNDAIDKVFQVWKAIVGQVTSKLAPVVAEMAENMLKVVGSVGGENIANTIAKVLLDAIDYLAGAFMRFAQFLDALIKKIAPLLGIELRSESERRRDELEGRQATRAWGGTTLTQEEMEELKRLRIKVEKEAAEEAAKASFETIVQAIKDATRAARERLDASPGGGRSASDSLNPTPGDSFSDTNIVRELRDINRNVSTRTVDIVGAK